jgi:hypothetical protein
VTIGPRTNIDVTAFDIPVGDSVVRERLNDSELASRLSYFLWSSMPDERLFAAARIGSLQGDELKKEVDRLLADNKSNRFINDFVRQWLQLHRLGMLPPDKKLYPNYDAWLEMSLRAEPVEFFREMFSKNLPVDSFIDSDWTMANARLCDFYGLPEPKTGGFQRVSLNPDDHRGGLLTMPSLSIRMLKPLSESLKVRSARSRRLTMVRVSGSLIAPCPERGRMIIGRTIRTTRPSSSIWDTSRRWSR